MKREMIWPPLGVALFFGLWALAIALSTGTMVPSPLTVVTALFDLAVSGSLFQDIAASLYRVLVGYVSAVVVGIPIGLVLGWYRRGEKALNPMIQVFRPISPLAWTPIAILWFGVGDLTAVFLIFIASSLAIIVAVMSAVHHVPLVNIRAGRNFGLTGVELMRRVIYPAVMPRVVVGLRVALGIAWIVVVAAEMIAVTSGLGFLIVDARNAIRYDLVVAGMVMIGIIGVLLDLVVRQLERLKSVRWGYQGSANDRVRRKPARAKPAATPAAGQGELAR